MATWAWPGSATWCPVAKGNGYGLGLERLAVEATRLGVDRLAVGTVFEIPTVAEHFHGDILVLSPWDPRDTVAEQHWQQLAAAEYAPRVIRTVSDVSTAKTLPDSVPAGTRLVLEGITSMRRFGMLETDLLAVLGSESFQQGLAQGRIQLDGLALHLPLAMPEVHHVSATKLPRGTSSRVIEVQGWAKTWRAGLEELVRAHCPVTENANALWVSHLTDDELQSLRGLEPDAAVHARVGTRLWLGDGSALSARGTILAVHHVGKRFAVGYRQRKAGSDGLLLVVGGGTSHGVAMAAPTPATSLRQRAIAAGTGALEATGRSRSPFQWGDKLLWFAEPPHMQVSMLWLPECGASRRAGPRPAHPCRRRHPGLPRPPHDSAVRRRPDMISILPSRDDRVVASGSEVAGGPAGTRVLLGQTWWNVFRVLIVMTAVAAVVGYLTKAHCLLNGWGAGKYTHLCYSDIPPLYTLRGLADGAIPYLSDLPADQVLEYPALTGVFVYLAARLTPAGNTHWFFDVNVLLLFCCWLVAVLATAIAQRTRPWDAAMVALAPGIILAGTINWDLLPVALVAVSLAFWSHNRPGWSGVFLGLGIAAKFYPLLLLGPMFLLCWRNRAWGAFGRYLLGAVVAWLVVNGPFMVLNYEGWVRFYAFSRERGEDFGSIWLALTTTGHQVPADVLNTVATGLFLLAAVGIAVLVWRAPMTPRVAQVSFLVVAAFLITNKVYSPQYVIWLIPLAALARPRWRDFLIWQTGEVVYFVAIWLYLAGLDDDGAKGLSKEAYAVAILIHVAVTVWLCGMVVRDVLRPAQDPVRTDGAGVLDPLAGPLDRAMGPAIPAAPPSPTSP